MELARPPMGLLQQCDLTYELIVGGSRSWFLFATVARVEARASARHGAATQPHDSRLEQEHRVYTVQATSLPSVKFS